MMMRRRWRMQTMMMMRRRRRIRLRSRSRSRRRRRRKMSGIEVMGGIKILMTLMMMMFRPNLSISENTV
jgi:hypothetical protein